LSSTIEEGRTPRPPGERHESMGRELWRVPYPDEASGAPFLPWLRAGWFRVFRGTLARRFRINEQISEQRGLEVYVFCSRCGTEMQARQSCPKCGRRIGDPVSAVAYSRLERHLHTLGILWIVMGGLFMIPALLFMAFGASGHMIVRSREILAGLFPLLVYLMSGTMVLLAAGGICVGLGLMQRRPWARAAAIILGVLALFHPPLGTALGVYTLWVLLADETGHEYRFLTRAS